MTRLLRSMTLAGTLTLLGALAAPPAEAISCRQWERMGPDEKTNTVYRMIDGTVSGSRGRQYHVDRGAVGRCLEASAQAIEYDFDGACADPRTAGKEALNRIFKNYIWTCAG